MPSTISADTCKHCFIDLDFDGYRSKLGTAAAFVNATDARYGFSSKDLRALGGSEISRIRDLMEMDHEWSQKNSIEVRAPNSGNRIVVRLFWDVAPLACENFATLCANGSQKKPPPIGESGKPLTYRGSTVHRIIPGFVIQGGDIVFGNGTGGESIYNGKKFKDERAGLSLKHDREGVLSMGNSGKNSNSSQFFITFKAAPQCDGKHVVFGEVVLDYVETLGSTESDGKPKVAVTITDCGVWGPLLSPGAGYWYDQPDAESFSGISPVFMIRPRVIILAPSLAVLERFQKAMGTFVAVTKTIAMEDGEQPDQIVSKITELLGNFSADVVVVAPACKNVVASLENVPGSWSDHQISVDEVVLVAKPVGALAAIRSGSWLSKRNNWQLDGVVRY